MNSEQFTTTLDPDIAERVHEFKEARGLNKSAAIERLVEEQFRVMDENAEPEPPEYPTVVSMYKGLLVACVVCILVGTTGYYSLTTGNFPEWAIWTPLLIPGALSGLLATGLMTWHRKQIENFHDEQHMGPRAGATEDGV